MKLLFCALVTLVSLGCFGQDGAKCALPNTTAQGVLICYSGQNCECFPAITFNTSGATTTSKTPTPADPYKYFWDDATGSFPMTCKFKPTPTDSSAIECRAAKSVPEDVLAIQEHITLSHDCKVFQVTGKNNLITGCADPPHDKDFIWTCADKSRILQVSENGTHWCHMPKNSVGGEKSEGKP